MKIGDVVQLKSQGPLMTISDVREDGYVEVAWFDVTDHLHTDVLPTEDLVRWDRVNEEREDG